MQDHAFPFLREILLFLTLAGIFMPLLQRLRINQVLGFLAVGAVVGPFGLGRLAARLPTLAYFTFPRLEGVNVLAELGVLFLMFMIGLELSAARLWAMRRWVFGAGTAQVLASAALLGGALAAFGLGWRAAAVLGLVLSLSSTAVVMQLMAARQSTTSALGQAAFAILMLQDLAVLPLLILIGVLSGGAGAGGHPAVLAATAIAKAALAIALIYLVGGRVVRPLFRSLVRHHQSDSFMALILLTTLGIAGLSAAAGLSMALGALIAGVLLAETEFKHEIELMIEPFRGLLMGLFFMTVGMGTDVAQVAAAPLLLAALLAGLIAAKTAVTSLVLRRGGLPWGRAIEGGLLLAQGGEFAFIAVAYALAGQLLDGVLAQRVMLVVTLSLFLTPLLARLGRTIGDRAAVREQLVQPEGVPPAAHGHIVIAGYGRVGQMLGKLLAAQHLPYLAFEADAVLVASLRQQGHPVYFGNAARAELLRRVQAGQARAIVLTMDHAQSSLQAVQGIRREFPDIPLFARARDEQQARLLKAAGATVVVPETLEASLQLSAFVLEAMGLDQAALDVVVEGERALFNAALSKQDGA